MVAYIACQLRPTLFEHVRVITSENAITSVKLIVFLWSKTEASKILLGITQQIEGQISHVMWFFGVYVAFNK